MDIISLLVCLEQSVDRTTLKQLSGIIVSLLTMTGRVTMLGISRWAEKGGSYRTVQRFFGKTLPWASMSWFFVRQHLLRSEHEYVLAGDETIVTKAGQQSFGLDRFFSSIYGKAVPGLAFFALSLVSVQERRSYPVMVEQRLRTTAEKEQTRCKQKQPKRTTRGSGDKKAAKGQRGRPKGKQNQDKKQIEWTPELHLIQAMLQKLMALVGTACSLTYLVMDGHFGNNNALQMVRQATKLHLISKLRHDAALYFRYEGEQKRFGPRRRYGSKLTYQAIPEQYQVESYQEEKIHTAIYQATMLHKSFACPLNVVILVKTNLTTGAHAHTVLFSSDLALPYAKLIDYYSLRFQLEFNFRDAKQFWGLEDFMHVKQTPVANAVNLSLFMVNLSHCLVQQLRLDDPDASLLDLKALFRGRRYALETLNLLPDSPNSFISDQIVRIIATLGSIHRRVPAFFNP
jgi:putative transposase